MIMTFGKHRGKHLRDIPADYLVWCLDNVSTLQPTLRREIRIRLGIQTGPQPNNLPVVARVLDPWYRQLAREFHPDCGGSHASMKAINRARELLVELAGVEK